MPVFLFADLAGFTALTEAHGDLDASRLAEQFEALVRERLPSGARLVKMIGDAAMVVADDEIAAVMMARDLVRGVEELPGRPAVRIGIASGEAVERGGDYWGHVVNIAARLAARAKPCEILTTDAVKAKVDASADPVDVYFEALGRQQLRGIPDALELFAVRLEHDELPTDPVCRMRLPDSEGAGTVRVNGKTYHFCSLECTRRFASDPGAFLTGGDR